MISHVIDYFETIYGCHHMMNNWVDNMLPVFYWIAYVVVYNIKK